MLIWEATDLVFQILRYACIQGYAACTPIYYFYRLELAYYRLLLWQKYFALTRIHYTNPSSIHTMSRMYILYFLCLYQSALNLMFHHVYQSALVLELHTRKADTLCYPGTSCILHSVTEVFISLVWSSTVMC